MPDKVARFSRASCPDEGDVNTRACPKGDLVLADLACLELERSGCGKAGEQAGNGEEKLHDV